MPHPCNLPPPPTAVWHFGCNLCTSFHLHAAPFFALCTCSLSVCHLFFIPLYTLCCTTMQFALRYLYWAMHSIEWPSSRGKTLFRQLTVITNPCNKVYISWNSDVEPSHIGSRCHLHLCYNTYITVFPIVTGRAVAALSRRWTTATGDMWLRPFHLGHRLSRNHYLWNKLNVVLGILYLDLTFLRDDFLERISSIAAIKLSLCPRWAFLRCHVIKT